MLKALFIFLFTEPHYFSLFHFEERAKLTTSSVPKDWIQMDEVLRKFSVHNKIQAMVLKQQKVWSGFHRLATSQGWQTLISLFCSNMMFIELSGSFTVIAEQTGWPSSNHVQERNAALVPHHVQAPCPFSPTHKPVVPSAPSPRTLLGSCSGTPTEKLHLLSKLQCHWAQLPLQHPNPRALSQESTLPNW